MRIIMYASVYIGITVGAYTVARSVWASALDRRTKAVAGWAALLSPVWPLYAVAALLVGFEEILRFVWRNLKRQFWPIAKSVVQFGDERAPEPVVFKAVPVGPAHLARKSVAPTTAVDNGADSSASGADGCVADRTVPTAPVSANADVLVEEGAGPRDGGDRAPDAPAPDDGVERVKLVDIFGDSARPLTEPPAPTEDDLQRG